MLQTSPVTVVVDRCALALLAECLVTEQRQRAITTKDYRVTPNKNRYVGT